MILTPHLALLILILTSLTHSINLFCSTTTLCPSNSLCQPNSMCACKTGFIGNCSIPAFPLTANNISANLTQEATYFSITPNKLNSYIEFTFTICLTSPLLLTFNLWGDNGQMTNFTNSNSLSTPSTNPLGPGCQQLTTTTYISFDAQPNGLDDLLILGITDNSQSASITISVTQQVIIGVFLYYYVLIGLISALGVIIVIGIVVFIYRKRMRNRAGAVQPPSPQPQYNNIDHFQIFMPFISGDKLQAERSICPICLQQIELAQVVRQTPCQHIFHSICLDSWGLKNMSCPVCRTDLSYPALDVSARSRKSGREMNVPMDMEDWEEQPEIEENIQNMQKENRQNSESEQNKQSREIRSSNLSRQIRQSRSSNLSRQNRPSLFGQQGVPPRAPSFNLQKYEIRQNML